MDIINRQETANAWYRRYETPSAKTEMDPAYMTETIKSVMNMLSNPLRASMSIEGMNKENFQMVSLIHSDPTT